MRDNDNLQEFPKLPKDHQDAVRLVQKQLKEQMEALDRRVTALTGEQKRRRIVAIVLKVISVLSGIVIATGFLQQNIVQVLGGIVPAIAALERVFANLSRLLSISAAKNAYERIRRQTVAEHNRQIIAVVEIRDREPAKAATILTKFVGRLRDRMAAAEDAVEDRLAHNDYDNLGRLTLEEDSSSA
jgi:hypothetical protein